MNDRTATEWLLSKTSVIQQIKQERIAETARIRAELEGKRDSAAEKMKVAFDKYQQDMAKGSYAVFRFDESVARYVESRRDLQNEGMDAGPWPDWYVAYSVRPL